MMTGSLQRVRRNAIWVVVAAVLLPAGLSFGQMLRYENHRELVPPDYATLRIGSFYSTMSFSQSVGYRYSVGSGSGTDFLVNNKRGVVREDGQEYPITGSLVTRNYVLLSRTTDLDVSLSANYGVYPLGTQEDSWSINLAEEGMMGNLSSDFILGPTVRGSVYERALYKTDYVDTRGLIDEYGGEQFEYVNNTLGGQLDWLAAKDTGVGLSLSRGDKVPTGSNFEEQLSTTYQESIAVENRPDPLYSVGAMAAYSQMIYGKGDRPTTGMQQYSVYGSARPTERTTLGASLGYSLADVGDGGGAEEDAGSGSAIGSLSLMTQLSQELSHSLNYSRAQRGGFSSALETSDGANYNLSWKGERASGSVKAGTVLVNPSGANDSSYSDSSLGGTYTFQVTDVIPINLSSTYSVRQNGEVPGGVVAADRSGDYATLAHSVGTGFPVMKELSFSAGYQHTDRMGDSENMTYTRDTVQALLTYSHQF